jgi:hypothetical protein
VSRVWETATDKTWQFKEPATDKTYEEFEEAATEKTRDQSLEEPPTDKMWKTFEEAATDKTPFSLQYLELGPEQNQLHNVDKSFVPWTMEMLSVSNCYEI